MRIIYQITSDEMGTVFLRKRKIAKALRWWLKKNGYAYKYIFFVN